MKPEKLPLIFFILLSFVCLQLKAQPQIELLPFASGLERPIGIVSAGDERLFVIQQRGLIRILDIEGMAFPSPFLDLSGVVSQSGNERGLLGLAFHPQYEQNGFFFLNYTRETDGHTVVSRFTVSETNADEADPQSEKIILIVEQPYANHNGGQLLFGPDGYLYIPTGDGGSGGDPENHAQNPASLLGKILRIDIDVEDEQPYAIPPDNPFVNDQNTAGEIWALGLRNPWRNSFDRYTGDLWIADVGQSEREEVNFQPSISEGGENYGWRCYEGNLPFNTEGCEDIENYAFPVFEYEHQGTGCTGAVTGGYVYRGALFNGMFGYYIMADYCTGVFYHISHTLEGDISPVLGDFESLQYTSFGQDQYGEIYVTLVNAGEIRRLVDTEDCRPVAWIMEEELSVIIEEGESIILHSFFNPALEYQWNRDEQPIEGETESYLEISEEGNYTVTVTNPENECSNTSEPLEVIVGSVSVNIPQQVNISVFPNPVSGNFTIDGLPASGKISIYLIDLTGKTIISQVSSNATSLVLSAHNLPSGVYLLKVSYDNSTVVRRVLVHRP